jgi:hypothetical protein
MTFQSPHPVDRSLSGWIEAYGRLKAAQKLVKTAGTGTTQMMRHDVDRLRHCAEAALKHLQTDFDAVRAKAENSPKA